MKPSAFFINTARAGLIEAGALHEALRLKRIAGAGLDVYDVEPLPADDPISAVVLGCGKTLDHIELLKEVVIG